MDVRSAVTCQKDTNAATPRSRRRRSRTCVAGGAAPGRRTRAPVLTTGVMATVGSAGLAISVGLLCMMQLGQSLFGSLAIGNSIAFTAFDLCLIVAALECRSETGTALTTASFDSKQMNRAVLVEVVLAVVIAQMDLFHRLLGTTDIDMKHFAWALVPALALLFLWELGKLMARGRGRVE
nr:cation-translocating P-type ATPase C-terminal domain-containing protein [Streptomyces monomycini]